MFRSVVHTTGGVHLKEDNGRRCRWGPVGGGAMRTVRAWCSRRSPWLRASLHASVLHRIVLSGRWPGPPSDLGPCLPFRDLWSPLWIEGWWSPVELDCRCSQRGRRLVCRVPFHPCSVYDWYLGPICWLLLGVEVNGHTGQGQRCLILFVADVLFTREYVLPKKIHATLYSVTE